MQGIENMISAYVEVGVWSGVKARRYQRGISFLAERRVFLIRSTAWKSFLPIANELLIHSIDIVDRDSLVNYHHIFVWCMYPVLQARVRFIDSCL